MNTISPEDAWAEANSLGQTLIAVLELGNMSVGNRQAFVASTANKMPLMRQAEFYALQGHGPWLVDMSHQTYLKLVELQTAYEPSALQGWIRSHLPFVAVAEHLSDALLAEDNRGTTYLLRSYAAEVLPILHKRTDTRWHPWLFGPVIDWWITNKQQTRRQLPGLAHKNALEYQPIQLDEALKEALGVDVLALDLTAELELEVPEAFKTDCHKERLTQVQDALAAARREGLQKQEDCIVYASIQLIDKQAPAHLAHWQQILDLVQNHDMPLAQAIRKLSA